MVRSTRLVLSALTAITYTALVGANPTDEAAIRDIERVWDVGWNKHDPKTMVSVLAEDVDFVNVAGEWFKGREAFQRHMERVHATIFAESTRNTIDTEIRFLTPEIALVHSSARISGDRAADGSPRSPRNVLMTRVVVKRGGKWVVVAAHNTNVVAASPVK
jgi:uncharacterized protein (TIGR02246 family)